MIELVSLLLGLLSGTHPVELSVTGPVAELELRLDGRTEEVLAGPPWRFLCDFGTELVPHELVVIARDAGGQELDRVRRLVNVRQQIAKAAMVLTGGEQGQPRAVGLVWESIGQRRPRSIELELDGQPLAVRDPSRVPLPAYDPEQMHFLSATLHFRDDAVARLEASFGGGGSSEVRSELTAVAISLDKGVRTPRREQLEGWFLAGGEPVRVHGVETGESEVIVVRDPAVQPVLEQLVAPDRSFDYISLGRKSLLRVVSPATAPLPPGELARGMFLWSEPHDAAGEGVLWLSQQDHPRSFVLLFPNAVALAGMKAHASTRRRAVVLLLGDSPTRPRGRSPESARNYLRLLQVPFFVWSLSAAPHPDWPGAEELDLSAGQKPLRRAIRRLRRTLEAQRIVWLDGSHLPQAIELAPRARGIRLVGSEETEGGQ